MSFRCVIVDDERPARERIKRLLSAEADLELAGEAGHADEAVELIERTTPDLCFLDVEMPEGDGFQVLKRLKHLPHVIFTTAYDQYAVRAFEVNSVDYLLKPFGKRRFAEAVERARQAMRAEPQASGETLRILRTIQQELRDSVSTASTPHGVDPNEYPLRITARRGPRIALLAPAEILWFESEETLVFARTATSRYLVEKTLVDLERHLAPDFFRAHRRFLVQLRLISEIQPEEAGTFRILFRNQTGDGVPLSRRQARKLREIIPW